MTSLRVFLLLLLAGFAAGASAQIYRWVDQNGRVHYTNEQPPKNVPATVVDPDAKESAPEPQSSECHTIRCQGERMEERQRRREAEEERAYAERAAAAPKAPRGLDFRNYLRIQRGMTEGELLTIAGPPDFSSDQGTAVAAPTTVQVDRNLSAAARPGLRMVTWTYLPTPADPFTTTITLIGGRVSDVDRARKF